MWWSYGELTHAVKTLAAALWKLKFRTALMLSSNRVKTYLPQRIISSTITKVKVFDHSFSNSSCYK